MKYLKLFSLFLATFFLHVFFSQVALATSNVVLSKDTLWKVQSIDTVKYSRDRARDSSITTKIPAMVKTVADLNATHIAIGTPYDEEFYPVLKQWVQEARKNHLSVWFRGNFSSWEGWFSYPLFSNAEEHHIKTFQFIKKHPELFQDGDIFTPAPEPENGKVIGDPRNSESKKNLFLDFLVKSYTNCEHAFKLIRKKTQCGYFSTNGDIAKSILTKEVVKQTGNVIVIDHYVKNPGQLQSDIEFLHQKFNAQVVIGEFGAPIPDINGTFSETQQADFVNGLLHVLYQERNSISGVNYWTLIEASTALLNDNGSKRKVVDSIKEFYIPGVAKGKVVDTFGKPLDGASIETSDGVSRTVSHERGDYRLTLAPGTYHILIKKEHYKDEVKLISLDSQSEITTNIALAEKDDTFFKKIDLALQRLIYDILFFFKLD